MNHLLRSPFAADPVTARALVAGADVRDPAGDGGRDPLGADAALGRLGGTEGGVAAGETQDAENHKPASHHAGDPSCALAGSARPRIVTRELPADEWPRLAETELGPVAHLLRPGLDRVIVVEAGTQIVGSWALMPTFHVEGVWIHPDYRGKGTVARRLLVSMKRLAQSVGARAVWTSAISDNVRQLIAHLRGVQVPGDHYVIPIEGDSECQPQ